MRRILVASLCIIWVFCFNLLAEPIDEFELEFTQEKVICDPLENYNRFMTSFNDGVYIYALNPIAKGYEAIAPKSFRSGISNVFTNLLFPLRFINTTLQGKFSHSFDELTRFLLNSTVGLAGWNDVAGEYLNIKKHSEDFGQTLGHYGIGSGAHIVLPILGPSNVRDIFGLTGDYFANPISYVDPSIDSFAIKTYENLNTLSFHTKEYEQMRKEVIDLYIFLRNSYESRRNALIKE